MDYVNWIGYVDAYIQRWWGNTNHTHITAFDWHAAYYAGKAPVDAAKEGMRRHGEAA
ncbi:hypothetical protein SHEEN_76 [Mycobacterium phage Sheen]|uniref:Uncharacterized protein n=1 Tax=Mycobacterium phage Sheen TaxID=1589274 RepID=A0A0B5A3N6_9CAUD|nr:hypothetical protein AVV31_gp18 [Mycobacterium phage Sheen]AJD82494.1 hypothetical protein SHEEN_76 [Mycobacterium phage Sheen]